MRWSAARALGGRADAVAALARALGTEQVARVREAIMTALMRVGDEASVRALLPYLRSQDAGQRATAIEALQALPEAIMPFMAALLGDERYRRTNPGDRTRPQYAGEGCHARLVPPAGEASSIPMCARRRSMCWPRSGRATRFRR